MTRICFVLVQTSRGGEVCDPAQLMIQDDPINQKPNGIDYFPLNNESEEEIIPFQSIKVKDNDEKNNVNSSDIYFKFALLIGLCKQLKVVIKTIIEIIT